jgi:threonine synthase
VAGAIDNRYSGTDEFKLLEVLSEMSGIKIPGPLVDIESKEVLHKKSCAIRDMKDMVSEVLGMG